MIGVNYSCPTCGRPHWLLQRNRKGFPILKCSHCSFMALPEHVFAQEAKDARRARAAEREGERAIDELYPIPRAQ